MEQAPGFRGRSRLTCAEKSATLVIPPRRQIGFVVAAAVIWVIGLAIVWKSASPASSGGGHITRLLLWALSHLPAGWAFPVALTLFIVLTLALACAIVYYVWRTETVEFTPDHLTLRMTVFGRLLEQQCYPVADVRAMRLADDNDRKEASLLDRNAWDDEGSCAFDYESSTVIFGANLPRAEARRVLELVRDQMPGWGQRFAL